MSLFLFLIFQSFLLNAQTFELTTKRFGNIEISDNMGVSVADYNGDMLLDIFIVGSQKDQSSVPTTYSRLFKNNNDGTYTDVTIEAGLFGLYAANELGENNVPGYVGYKLGASWGDFNNDSYPDLFLTNAFKVQFFKNNGDGTFTDITESAGFPKTDNCHSSSSTWFDYNNDGLLDIFISDYKSDCGSRMYKNLGNETFEDVTANTGFDVSNKNTFMAYPIDVNKDGYLDLYLSNDFSQINDLFLNKGGDSFIEKSADYGLNVSFDAMGIGVGDYNLDSNLDMVITDIVENVLLRGRDDGSFEEVDQQTIFLKSGWGWDTRFSDFDNDGDEDVLISTGQERVGGAGDKRGKLINAYFQNSFRNGGSNFENTTTLVGLHDVNITNVSEVFDYDNDGDLDIFFANLLDSSVFYENNLIVGQNNSEFNWLKIKLEGTTSNKDGIGAQIEIDTDFGTQIRAYTGIGLFSQSLQPVHFGIGTEGLILELRIKWPSGIVDTYSNVAINQHIKAIEGSTYETLIITPSVKISGCTDPTSCNYNPSATIDDGSCTYLVANAITGNNASNYLKEETYKYTLDPGSTIVWQVDGGEIVEGQGTGTLKVHWKIASSGKVIATETNGCSTLPVVFNVNLTPANTSLIDNVSIARLWNEVLLEAIRNDFARPTVHARNLYHISIAMYDSWSVYDTGNSDTFLLGKTMGNYTTPFDGFTNSGDIDVNRSTTLSYAVYQLLKHRFKDSPGASESLSLFDLLMDQFGYDKGFTSTDYSTNDPAALGNYIAENLINFGYVDGAREVTGYDNGYYQPINQPLPTDLPGNTTITDPNRWQPLTLETFIDQSGNLIPGSTPDFLSPEWGDVVPFALKNSNMQTLVRNGNSYNVFHAPGIPPYLDINNQTTEGDQYKWGFSLVSIWGSHLDPSDGVMVDISPKSKGNIPFSSLPTNFSDFPNFYNTLEGGDIGTGYSLNPATNAPYQEQLVPRGDYARVLAEFWADGPDSETPPGHWFTLLNYVNDHEATIKKFEGVGEMLTNIEWDIKSYFLLAGAMHDSAIAAWSVKGWYDYIRPVSAIRYMAELGQSTDSNLSNYHIGGIPLEPGKIEVVNIGDALAGSSNEHVGKIKLFTWKGHRYIPNPDTDNAGVDWILAENWMPYQRSSFVTPPFAGYVSGHSTYSRAAAEVLTRLTGDAYFPGGMGEFVAKKDEFLVFENGPSQDVVLQWATYRDASDQCSLSRIWGGIHPPADDIPGRIMGEVIGIEAFDYGKSYFDITLSLSEVAITKRLVYPNPVKNNVLSITNTLKDDTIKLTNMIGSTIHILSKNYITNKKSTEITISETLPSGIYILSVNKETYKIVFL